MADPVTSIDDFLSVVRKSGLVDEARLEEACAAWADRSQPLPDDLVRTLVDGELLTQWQVDQLRKGKHRGFILGKYKLLRLLGAGGMSSVYLAEHVNLHGKVAIKVLPVKNVDKTSYLARFEREAREAFRLSHPNIVRATDLDTSGAIHYLAMEYVEGVDLHAKVKQGGPLPVHEAADYVRQAALGLQYAHEEGVVHRDIKPANMILDRRGSVKILDFGLALAGKGDEDGSLTQEFGEKVLGTADYLAPEQARDSHKADNRSDIYALGCTLYYLLVGRVPFAGGKLADRIRAHETTPPPNPLDDRSDIPPAVVELYFRMMEKHPEARPQTAKEVADALAPWTQATAAAATPAPQLRRLPPRRTGTGQTGAGTSSPAAGAALLTPPASGAGRRPSGSGVGSGPLAFTPPSRSVAGRGPAKPTATKGKKGPTKPTKPGGETGEDEPETPRRRRPLTFAGLPLAFWIVAAAGVILAITLAVFVLLGGRGKTASRSNREPGGAAVDQGASRPARDDAPPADPEPPVREPSPLDDLAPR